MSKHASLNALLQTEDIPYALLTSSPLVRDTCLCLYVQRAARALARRFDDALRSLGLTNGQFSLLMSLNRPEPPTMGAMAELLALDRTTLTAAIKPLERRGLITVSVDERDRRSRRLSLTPSGYALLVQAIPVWREAHVEVEVALPAATNPDDLRTALLALSEPQPGKVANHQNEFESKERSAALSNVE
jgi:DNA-binding MarR family transcriptional regulator